MGKKSVRLAALAVVLAAVAAGIAYAAIPTNGVIHGCYTKQSGGLRVIDPSAGQSCNSREAALQWNQQGEPGPQGLPGPPGPSDAYTSASPSGPLDFAGGEMVTVASLSLPAGSYVFNAKVVVGNRTGVDDEECLCHLRYGPGGTGVIDTASTRLSGGAPFESGSTSTLPNTGSKTFATAETVLLTCFTTASSAFAQWGQINAVRVATLTEQ